MFSYADGDHEEYEAEVLDEEVGVRETISPERTHQGNPEALHDTGLDSSS